jgi:hypothetical protein
MLNRIVRGGLALALLFAPEAAFAAYVGTPPLLVANGGTGAATFTAHGVLLGEGTSALGVTATGTSGIPLIGQGSSADPIFGTAVVGGGGTGLTTLTAHAILIGAGTSNVAFATAAADSVPLWQSSSADPTVTAINNCSTALTYATASHTFGCNASAGVIPTESTVTGSGPFTIATTNLLTTVSSMATPAAATYNLPAIQAAGWRECLKDGTTGFASNNATVKPNPTSLTIDGVAGTSGIVMNQNRQELCFMSDGTNWLVE